MLEAVIISDDLTGACDSASYFCSKKIPVEVAIDAEELKDLPPGNQKIIALNTDSRPLSVYQGIEKVKKIMKKIDDRESIIAIKKIDTAFRGNVCAEIVAVMDSLGRKICFLIPAIPDMGRFTIDGNQIFNGKPIDKLDFAKDPVKAVRNSHIPGILKNFPGKAGHIGLETIRKGHKAVQENVKSLVGGDRTLIIFDSLTNDDIDVITASLTGQEKQILWCGSLGLMRSLGKIFFGKKSFPRLRSARVYKNKKGMIGFSGSAYRITKEQISKAGKNGYLEWIKIQDTLLMDFGGIAGKEKPDEIIKNIRELASYESVFISVEPGEKADGSDLGERILELLSAIAERVLSGEFLKTIQRIVIIGGDTSFRILKKFGVNRLSVLGMLEPGVSFSRIMDGNIEGIELCMKGGSVGGEDTVINMLGAI